jgi:hypothetical protein
LVILFTLPFSELHLGSDFAVALLADQSKRLLWAMPKLISAFTHLSPDPWNLVPSRWTEAAPAAEIFCDAALDRTDWLQIFEFINVLSLDGSGFWLILLSYQ